MFPTVVAAFLVAQTFIKAIKNVFFTAPRKVFYAYLCPSLLAIEPDALEHWKFSCLWFFSDVLIKGKQDVGGDTVY